MKRLILLLLLFPAAAVPAHAQDTVLPGLAGSELRRALAEEYRPPRVLRYGAARDTLFRRIDAVRDSLRGVYTGFTIFLDPAADPTLDAFRKGINTEHTFPQSMGATVGTAAHSDMHHLFPVKGNVNSSRGNHPFDEIPDAETDAWYRLSRAQSTPPSAHLHEYSEKDNAHPNPAFTGRFEPREDHKGNAARAIFYFVTMYPGQASEPFFEVQKDVLYAWHSLDPADSAEVSRTHVIAGYQGTPNPFVLDSTLVRRAFFSERGPSLALTARYRFDGNRSCPSEDDGPEAQPEGGLLSRFTRTGLACSSGGGVFNSRGWPSAASRVDGRYVSFTASPAAGGRLSLGGAGRLCFRVRRSGTGPPSGEVRYRIGEGPFTSLGTWTLGSTEEVELSFILPDTTTSGVVEFRFYGWGARSQQGTLRFDDLRLGLGGTSGMGRRVPPRQFKSGPGVFGPLVGSSGSWM